MFYSDTYKRIIELLGWSYYVSYHIGLKVVFSCILLFVLCCVWQIKTIDWLAPTRAICSSSSFRASLLPARGIMYGRPQHFSRGGQWGVWRTEVPRQGPGAAPRWVSGGGEALRRWHFLKMLHKYFIYWGFRQHFQQKHFSTFPGGKCPPPCPCLRAPVVLWQFRHTSPYSDSSTRPLNIPSHCIGWCRQCTSRDPRVQSMIHCCLPCTDCPLRSRNLTASLTISVKL